MIYLDTSAALAELLAEDRKPDPEIWSEPLIASRLLQYEVWNRIHARRLERSHGASTMALLNRVSMLELVPMVLSRALEPFPVPVRTLDALHLASAEYLLGQHVELSLVTFDERMREAAKALKIPMR